MTGTALVPYPRRPSERDLFLTIAAVSLGITLAMIALAARAP